MIDSIDQKVQQLFHYLHDLLPTCVIDLRGVSDIIDYFIISTVHSHGQLRGIVHKLHEVFYNEGIACRGGKKEKFDSDWFILDCEYFLIHLMTEEMRNYYELEEFWETQGAKIWT